ncbi:MAG: hypothetical protein QNJ30_12410 [Kiloniellales bacterium]|nr:hypothetical protein [Kiloniellales bacterium]
MPKDPIPGPLRPSAPETGAAMLPLDFMLALLRDETANLADRKWAAERAAPYCHARATVATQDDPGIRQEEALDALA